MLVINWVQEFSSNHHLYMIQFVSAWAGVLTVFLTYIFAKRIYQNCSIALLSAFFMAASTYHVFYSRLAMPESSSCLLVLGSLCVYVAEKKPSLGRAILAGVLISLAFLINPFRVFQFPLYFFFIAFAWEEISKENFFVKLKCAFQVIVPVAVIIIFIQLLSWGFIKTAGLSDDYSYLGALMRSHPMQPFHFDFISLFTYPYVIYQTEGMVFLMLLLATPLTWRLYPQAKALFYILIAHVFVFTLTDEKSARMLTTVWPIVSILCASVICALYAKIPNKSWIKILAISVVGILFLHQVLKALDVPFMRSDMARAGNYISKKYANEGILSTNRAVLMLYVKGAPVKQIRHEGQDELRFYEQHGFKTILIDPQKFIFSTETGGWVESKLTGTLTAIERQCEPSVTFHNFNQNLQDRFILDHILPSLKGPQGFINNKPADAGKIKIYDLKDCLDVLSKG